MGTARGLDGRAVGTDAALGLGGEGWGSALGSTLVSLRLRIEVQFQHTLWVNPTPTLRLMLSVTLTLTLTVTIPLTVSVTIIPSLPVACTLCKPKKLRLSCRRARADQGILG